jgi:hypothetical protein
MWSLPRPEGWRNAEHGRRVTGEYIRLGMVLAAYLSICGTGTEQLRMRRVLRPG